MKSILIEYTPACDNCGSTERMGKDEILCFTCKERLLGYNPVKSVGADKVLKLMDSEEGGNSRYAEFVAVVAKELEISTYQLEEELEPFI